MRARNAVDFDDLLLLSTALLERDADARAKYQLQLTSNLAIHLPHISHISRRYQRTWSHLLVDEFQDTNALQYALLHLLGARHRNVFVVGDADQG